MVTDLDAAGARAALPADAPATDAACPVVVSVAGAASAAGTSTRRRRLGTHDSHDHPATVHANEHVHFSADSTPTVEEVTPNFGSSLGGETITVSGSGFIPGHPESHTVTLAGVDCAVQSVSPTSITCTTTKRGEELHAPEVVVTVDGHGEALVAATVAFRFLDRWSSLSTWFAAGGEPPVAGDSVVIPKNQAVLLDVSPPELFLLLVQGTLVFDRQDLALDASYILIKGGRFEVGTEDEPFVQNAVITLHGDRYESVEIPHAGAKCLAVRDAMCRVLHWTFRDPSVCMCVCTCVVLVACRCRTIKSLSTSMKAGLSTTTTWVCLTSMELTGSPRGPSWR